MKAILKILSLAVFFAYSHQSKATDTLRVIAVGKVYSDSLVLRFAPADAITFETAKTSGIKIERAILPKNTEGTFEFKVIEEAFRMKDKAFWLANFSPKDTAAGIAAQLLFGENDFQLNNDAALQLQQQKDLQNSRFAYSMLSADQDIRVANAMGLRLVDRDFQKSEKYVYRLSLNGVPAGFASDTAWVIVDASEMQEKSIPPTPEAKLYDSMVELSWRLPLGYSYSGFNLYRSKASAKPEKLNQAIIVESSNNQSPQRLFFFKDSVQNYIEYSYFLVGIDAFADKSQASASVSVITTDMTPPPPAQILSASSDAKGQINVVWEYTSTQNDLDAFMVVRATTIDGNYQTVSSILPKTSRNFIDKDAPQTKGSFYKILSLDTTRNGSWSLPFYGFFLDSIPPASPVGLKAKIDTNSIVTLTWNIGSETDLQGYRVFYSNAADHRFTLLTGHILADTVYHDTIQKRTLSRDIFYRIVAVDKNSNHSEPCQFIKLKRLDVIPPVAAIFEDVTVQDSTVLLKWINSSSVDLASIRLLYRPQGNENPWQELNKWTIKDSVSTFKTRNLKAKSWYEFTIESTDSSDLKSLCIQPAQIRTYDTGIRSGIAKIDGNYETLNKSVKLSWNENLPKTSRLLIYRKTPDSEGLSKYKVIASAKEFVDSEILKKGEYLYTIKVIYSDGSESLPAQTISVAIN